VKATKDSIPRARGEGGGGRTVTQPDRNIPCLVHTRRWMSIDGGDGGSACLRSPTAPPKFQKYGDHSDERECDRKDSNTHGGQVGAAEENNNTSNSKTRATYDFGERSQKRVHRRVS
jgi:hypothetical protein